MPGFLLDIVAYSPASERVLVVECKAGKETSAAAAAELRRNLVHHSLVPTAPYFMLALSSRLLIWKPGAPPEDQPSAVAPIKPVLQQYVGTLVNGDTVLRSETLEVAVYSWLSDLASGVRQPSSDIEAEQILIDTGLYDALKGGAVRSEVPS